MTPLLIFFYLEKYTQIFLPSGNFCVDFGQVYYLILPLHIFASLRR